MPPSSSLPKHVALILDGNGRWAQSQGLPRLSGHQRGAEAVKKIVQDAPGLGISYLTVFAFSSENWKRPAPEVFGLMQLLQQYLETEVQTLHQKGVRLRVIGNRKRLSEKIQQLIEGAENLTKNNTTLGLQVALSYGSREEITRAFQAIARKIQEGILRPEEITEHVVAQHLDTAGIPDPDLLIRTSGEQRISNYLLWQSAYAELVFVDKFWPDFSTADLEDALKVYQKRERRFGRAA